MGRPELTCIAERNRCSRSAQSHTTATAEATCPKATDHKKGSSTSFAERLGKAGVDAHGRTNRGAPRPAELAIFTKGTQALRLKRWACSALECEMISERGPMKTRTSLIFWHK